VAKNIRVVRTATFVVPASSFGIVLGMAGLSNCWRVAQLYWPIYSWIDDVLFALTSVVWALLVVGFFYKWFAHKSLAIAEVEHPVQCCFIGLLPVSTLLVATWFFEWYPVVGTSLIFLCAFGQLGFSVTRFGGMLRGGRKSNDITPVMYLPSVAGNFVSAIALNAIGSEELAKLFFGAGFFSWMALESVILQRLLSDDALLLTLRPTLGIQLAPPVVGGVAYLSVSNGQVDLFFYALMGYGILQLLFLTRLIVWFGESGFKPSLWAFSFGITALALASLRAGSISEPTWFASAAPFFFLIANVAIMMLFFLTVSLLMVGKLFRLEDS